MLCGLAEQPKGWLTSGPAPQLANALNTATTSSSDTGMSLHAFEPAWSFSFWSARVETIMDRKRGQRWPC